MIKTISLPSGEKIPALGQGTWQMGEHGSDAEDVRTLKLGIELGMTLIDTAEMYGDGHVETLVAQAIAGQRDRIFLVSKVYPHNATSKGMAEACARSLKRLKTDRLDLYLLHWRGTVPMREIVAGFEELKRSGKIRDWGVSNLSTKDMQELFAAGGTACASNQILYNLQRRGPEAELIPWLAARGIPVMAYSPFEQGKLPTTGVLLDIARAHDAHPYQIALAWLLQKPGIIAIPKTGKEAHLRANRAAADMVLSAEQLAALDKAFPPPRNKKPPLATL
jgi:diketogulonate reductase-like aldo/keto reductase